MGRWHSIVAKKTAGDQQKGKNYSMMSKLIQIAAKKGADPKMNPSLEMVLAKARYYSLPRDIVERAILKGSGQLEGENFEEIFYEGYGPSGSAVLVKSLTSNTNRSATNIKTIFFKGGGSIGQPGSVAWQFHEKGIIIVDGKSKREVVKGNDVETILPLDSDSFELEVMELPVEGIEIEDGIAVVTTEKTDFSEVSKGIEALGYHIQEADLQFLPENMVSLSADDRQKFEALIVLLEADDDVDKVWHNVE